MTWATEHKILLALASVIVLGLISFATIQVFIDIEKITAPVAAALGTVWGGLAAAGAWLKFRHNVKEQD